MGLFESKEEKAKRLEAEAKIKAEKEERNRKEREAYEARIKAEQEEKELRKQKEQELKLKAKRIVELKNEIGLANVFPDSEISKVLITQNETIIDLLVTMTIAQGAIAGTSANMARTTYHENLAKLETNSLE